MSNRKEPVQLMDGQTVWVPLRAYGDRCPAGMRKVLLLGKKNVMAVFEGDEPRGFCNATAIEGGPDETMIESILRETQITFGSTR